MSVNRLVPVALLRKLMAYLERSVGDGKPYDRELSLLIDGLRKILERGRR